MACAAIASKQSERRRFLRALLAGTTAAAILRQDSGASAAAVAEKSFPELPEGDGALLRMQRELRAALQKPVDKRRWAMVIDLRKCIGCHGCTVACVAENKLPPGVVYRPVKEEESGSYPKVTRRFLPHLCNHCENPPCVPVCPVTPVKATNQRPDGIVDINYDTCIGCGLCVGACPYGARTLDKGELYTAKTPKSEAYEKLANFEYGHRWGREASKPPVGKARKCHFCLHRQEAGMLPACVVTCIGHATFFGDADDPKSLVSELIAKSKTMRLKEELGTKPRVYYLV